MRWPTVAAIGALTLLPQGYRFAPFGRAHVAELIAALRVWYPGIAAGVNGRYPREDFYGDRVCLDE